MKNIELEVLQEDPKDAEKILMHALHDTDFPTEFSLLGRQWELIRGVFPGTLTGATEVMATALPYPVGGRMLEVGCGSGVISITAALSGVSEVVALDINPNAVTNTLRNAIRHGVEAKVSARVSDVFSALEMTEDFDLIFWNVPWTYVDGDFDMASELHAAVFDPEYAGQRRLIQGAPTYLRENGRLLIGTADLKNGTVLETIVKNTSATLSMVQRIRRIEAPRVMEYHLMEVCY
ncbi:class I SAM-dependent methyltransferase [Photorhabdus temperata]|uniref:16S RNA methylase RsmC n=1 Tax=Photorhabdus temperata subsp. temperata Meg1 TaxID=1393735 RepID=A0A081RWQ0_PHOTE|nr:methyltransferase [Photorhabdus temperata]EQC00180.1 N-methyl-transferase [Photorhabdus temperata subsp. temperata M1021]KER03103.1 16S RNA methylase RsmC [Photorhabdus temperata subsp. temperata Meg1]MCT8347904.1 class I SAM-dependent methyltransferase [Photorhabdus temperata]